jgi:hypothetical protein
MSYIARDQHVPPSVGGRFEGCHGLVQLTDERADRREVGEVVRARLGTDVAGHVFEDLPSALVAPEGAWGTGDPENR